VIDISEPMFDLVANPSIRVGFCAMVVDDHVVYAGPIRPGLAVEGCEMFMHPKDCRRLEAHMKKQLN